MLQPKRTRFRKQFKGRNRGLATTGNKVSFGEYGLKAVERGKITARQIEAARRAMTRHIAQITRNCARGDLSCRPRQRQALLHWAYDSRRF